MHGEEVNPKNYNLIISNSDIDTALKGEGGATNKGEVGGKVI